MPFARALLATPFRVFAALVIMATGLVLVVVGPIIKLTFETALMIKYGEAWPTHPLTRAEARGCRTLAWFRGGCPHCGRSVMMERAPDQLL